MRKFAVLAVCSLVNVGAVASDDPNGDEFCRSSMELAEVIMTNRQNGLSLSDMLDGADYVQQTNENEYGNQASEVVNKVTRLLVLQAYKEPVWGIPNLSQNAINDFATKTYFDCLDGFTD